MTIQDTSNPHDDGGGLASVLLILAFGFAVWMAATAAAATVGLVAEYRLLVGPVAALSMVGLIALYFRWAPFRALMERVGPYGLAYFHIWRIAAGALFLGYGAEGLLPEVFYLRAGWGDVAAGVLAAALLVIPKRVWSLVGVHLFGFADFLLAVGTGMTLVVLADPGMAAIASLPLALIPLVGVPISGASHIIALDLIRRGVR